MKTFSTIRLSVFLPPRPQEDYLLVSKKYPIFTVADGVTLQFKNGVKYPNISGAAKAAEIFCQVVISEAEKRYGSFKESDLKEIFKIANVALADYNASCGITKEKINYFDKDFFSATTAFMLIKDKKAYWYSLCDSGVIVFNRNSRKILSSPVTSPIHGKFLPAGWKKMNHEKRAKIMHAYRNIIGENGELLGYGVADGEEGAVNYLNCGVADLNDGDLAVVYTDGFEDYFRLESFTKIFTDWSPDLEQKLDSFMGKMAKRSKKKYGLERSLIAIKV